MCALRVGKKSDNMALYSINNQELRHVTIYKDLCITISNNLGFTCILIPYVKKIYMIINRIFPCFVEYNYLYLLKAYVTYIKPILDYNYSIWNPGNIFFSNFNSIEKVQGILRSCYFIIVFNLPIFSYNNLFFKYCQCSSS